MGAVLVFAPQGRSDEPRRMPPAKADAPAGAAREAMPEHAVDVADYTLRASLDPAQHMVHGEGTITWRNTARTPVREIYLHLYLNAFKNDRTVFLRGPLRSGRGTSPVRDWGYIDVRRIVARELDGVDLWPSAEKNTAGDPDDQTDIRVPLPREVPPGGTLTLDVAWDDKLPAIVERTGYAGSFHMVAQWFPKVARLEQDGTWAHFPFYHLSEFYADFGTYDVTLDVPDGQIVGASGVRVSEAHEGGRTVLRYVQGDIHDFAWTAWERFHEKTAEASGVSIRALYPPGYDALADREITAVKFGLQHFGELYGRYPYPVLTVVHPPEGAAEAGGMEYPTLITAMGHWLEPSQIHDVEDVTIHEFGHQYFYGLIATNEEKWPFLDEGLNSYAEGEAMTAMFGAGSGVDALGLKVSVPTVHRTTSAPSAHNEPVAQPAHAFAGGSDYGALVYGRTATILDTMAGVYGKEELLGALGRYARRYRFGHPGLPDFVAVVREELGDGAAENLRTALSERGWVDYVASDATTRRRSAPAGIFDREGKRETFPEGSGTSDGAWEGWALVMRHGTLHLPVDIELVSENGAVRRVRWNGREDWLRVPYEGDSPLARVAVDPGATVTLDEDLLNNHLSLSGRPSAVRSIERASYWTLLLLQGLMP
jgi:hypothetical protein